jgi:hypothetical protein
MRRCVQRPKAYNYGVEDASALSGAQPPSSLASAAASLFTI